MTPELEQQAIAMAKSVGSRFIKGGISGMGAMIALVSLTAPHTWTELNTALVALAYAAITGFFSGGFLAIEKWYNWTPE